MKSTKSTAKVGASEDTTKSMDRHGVTTFSRWGVEQPVPGYKDIVASRKMFLSASMDASSPGTKRMPPSFSPLSLFFHVCHVPFPSASPFAQPHVSSFSHNPSNLHSAFFIRNLPLTKLSLRTIFRNWFYEFFNNTEIMLKSEIVSSPSWITDNFIPTNIYDPKCDAKMTQLSRLSKIWDVRFAFVMSEGTKNRRQFDRSEDDLKVFPNLSVTRDRGESWPCAKQKAIRTSAARFVEQIDSFVGPPPVTCTSHQAP